MLSHSEHQGNPFRYRVTDPLLARWVRAGRSEA
jgi:hypothetical protein